MPSKLSDFDVICTIGSGSYGKCEKIRRRSDGKILVWKDMDYGSMTEPEKQQLVFEVNLLRELRHKHIVRYHDRIIDRSNSRLYLIMEHCGGGDLSELINKYRKERRYVDEQLVIKIFVQLALALSACHNQHERSGYKGRVLHRDLKPANVFLDEQQNVKLGDFGLARVLHHDTSFAKTFVGTPYYMSPEQMKKVLYNEKSDIWSLGCLVYELCALIPPFTAPNQKLLAVKIKEGNHRRIPSRYSDELNECIDAMLHLSPSKRPQLRDVLKLPFLQKTVQLFETEDSKTDGSTEATNVHDNGDEGMLRSEKKVLRSDAVEKESTLAFITQKEMALEEKLRHLNIKERDLQRRERLVDERERAAEEKMKTAERMIKEYREMTTGRMKYKHCEDEKYTRKQVHFAHDAKENIGKYNIALRERADAPLKINKPGPISEYRKKLRDMNINDDLYRVKNAKASYYLQSDRKPLHVLGMR